MHPGHRWAGAIFVIGGLVLATAAGAQEVVIPVKGPAPGARTGLIVGQVVDAATGAAIPNAVVQISLPKYYEDPASPKDRVMADGEGRFFFAELPPGDYYVRATKEGYAGAVYGQQRPSGPTRLLTLAEGERRTDVKLSVWKYSAIAGTVVDEAGEPVIGVKVYALSREFLAGRPRFGKMITQPWTVPTATTDDRGMFRISALTPADYAIAVPSTQTTVPVAVLNSFPQNSSLRGDLLMAVQPNGGSNASAVYATFPLGQSRAQQLGDVALLTMNGVQIPPPPTPAGRLDVYPTTYYPAALTASAARLITVKAGEERADVSVKLQPTSAVRVSGRLITPSGAPPGPTIVRLIGASALDVSEDGFETVVGMSDANGRFTLLGVPPGDYVLKTNDRFISIRVRQGLAGLWAEQAVSVGANDIDDLAITMRPPVIVSGRIESHAANPLPALAARAVAFERPSGERGFAAEVSGGNFSIAATAGRYIVRPMEISGWVVDSVMIDGKNVTDAVVDISGDTSLVVSYTDRRSPVAGAVKDARGVAAAGALALVFPANPERWVGYGTNPRTLKSAQAGQDGEYKIDHLPPGEYFVVAMDGAAGENWMDPKTLELLARQASKITVVAGEPTVLDLTLKVIR
jgi:hypothetical protein